MTFTFETNGNNTFLVYAMGQEERLDTMTLGMITQNKIPGLAPVLYAQRNAERFLKYNVTAKVTVRQFFSGTVNRRRLLGVFAGIAEALSAAEEYMIEPCSLILDIDYIYADVTSCRAEMICLPVMDAAGGTDAGMFFKNIMFGTRFDQTENCDYVARIINYLNSATVFMAEEFGRLLQELMEAPEGMPNAGQSGALRRQGEPTAPRPQEEWQAGAWSVGQPGSWPVSRSEDQAVGPQGAVVGPSMVGPQGVPGTSSAVGSQGVSEVSSAVGPQETVGTSSAIGPQGVPGTSPAVGPQGVPGTSSAVSPQGVSGTSSAVSPSAAQEAVRNFGKNSAAKGFAVPGQDAVLGFAVPGQEKALGKGTAAEPKEQEKGMSMLYLLQHYNKENAAAYKAQKQARKNAGKIEKQPLMPQSEQQFAPQSKQQFAPQSEQQFMPQSLQGEPLQERRPASWPASHSGDFGETVMVEGDPYGENTVVVTEVQGAFKPYLIRCGNNEKILLEKPVFRIGKERSYVDYCITGNATVSRSHADIIQRDGQFYIVDNNSTNHTYVDGEMIPSNTEMPLVHGTKIRLSNEEFEFKTF